MEIHKLRCISTSSRPICIKFGVLLRVGHTRAIGAQNSIRCQSKMTGWFFGHISVASEDICGTFDGPIDII